MPAPFPCRSAPCAQNRGQGPLTYLPANMTPVGWVERSDTHRRGSMGFAKAQPILRKAPRCSRQDSCSYRLPGGTARPVEADLVRDSRNHRRASRIRSAPTPSHPHHSLRAKSRAGPAPTDCREARHSSPVGADLVRDSRNHRRVSRIRSAPTPPHPHHPLRAKSRAGPACMALG